ncbi:Calx-beta domain-containing protein [Deinococcus sp.]|uniref:Calx-beta domain-containing protein n=1 Tax=Deinococcus sp. TaxID=47478 RepID=UPI003B5B39DC
MTRVQTTRLILISAGLLALGACGGGGPPPAVSALTGAGGGTLSSPSGAGVVIPPGALAAETAIAVEQTSAGAPPLPTGLNGVGQMFAFTPHGTVFAQPVTMTLPFDPATVPAGQTPQLFKTNAQNQWEQVQGATFGANTVSAAVTGFSFAQVVIVPVQRFPPSRRWDFSELRGEGLDAVRLPDDETQPQVGGTVFDLHDYSFAADTLNIELPANFAAEFPPDERGSGEVFSSESGRTYSAYAESAGGKLSGGAADLAGSRTHLHQTQTFIKRAPDATLTFTVSSIVLAGRDGNGVLGRSCPDQHQGLACDLIGSEVTLSVTATKKGQQARFWGVRSGVALQGGNVRGSSQAWDVTPWNSGTSNLPLWAEGDFRGTFRTDEAGFPETVIVELISPRTFSVDISSVEVNETFTLSSSVFVDAYDRTHLNILNRGNELATYAAGYLRDPQKTGGTVLTATGLEGITPEDIPEGLDVPLVPAPCVPGPAPDPAAGVLQFSASTFATAEGRSTPMVTVTRTGGSRGAVSATVRTSDSSARAGVDYEALNSSVFFGDGDAAERSVEVLVIPNKVAGEAAKTVNITLSQPGGCGALGAQPSTVLTITDDDSPPPPPNFTVGGTVTGLVGTGLVLRDHKFLDITPSNGAFTFPQPTTTGFPYAVTVVSQPANPLQTCSVTNGTGTISNANVTNVNVTCVTPAASSGLDPGFGDGGKAFTAFGGDETALALQADGKVVMVGGSVTDFTLARYTAAGRLDASFGSAGRVTTDIATGADQARGVAIQSDGKIVVVGSAAVGRTANNLFNLDFAVARYNADGTPDSTFSGDGKVTTDFNLLADVAHAVAIQRDGKIVVVGSSAQSNLRGSTDFALARYNTDGTLDAGFSGDGKVTTAVGSGVDFARNVVLQTDQNILVSGFSEVNARDGTGLARYTPGGVLDAGFGSGGKTAVPEHRLDEGLAVQGGGKIVIAGSADVGVFPARSSQFAVMRLSADGRPDNSFGTAGLATTAFSTLNDFGRALALQGDGKIIVAGQSSNGANPDFGVARFSPDGTLDSGFGSGGRQTVSFFDSFDGAESVAVQPDGKLVLGGFATSGTQTGYGLARVNP